MGVGAVTAPPLIAFLQRSNDTQAFLLGLAAALTLTAAALARSAPVPRQEATDSVPGSVTWWNRGVLLFGALLFVYVGTETAIAGWVGVYAERLNLTSAIGAVAAPSVFWGLLLLGRALAPLVLLSMPEERLVGLGLLLATAGVGAMLVANSAGIFFFAVMLGGLGLSTVFPITVSLFTRTFEGQAARLAGPVFALAGLGGATLPSLVGFISAQLGSLKAGLFVPLLGCVLMLALHGWRARLEPGRPRA